MARKFAVKKNVATFASAKSKVACKIDWYDGAFVYRLVLKIFILAR